MTERQLLRTIESLGGGADERELCSLVDPARHGALVDALRRLEADGMVEVTTTIVYRLTPAGRRELGAPA